MRWQVRATVVQSKPFVLVHEADEAKGGLSLEASKAECPAELQVHASTLENVRLGGAVACIIASVQALPGS